MNTHQNPVSVSQRVLEHLQVTDVALEKAAAAEDAATAMRTKVAAAIPTTVEALIANKLILPTEREKAAEALQSHETTIELLARLAARHKQAAAAEVPVLGQKVAANGQSGYVGGANHSGIRESDLRLFRGLGLAAPTGA